MRGDGIDAPTRGGGGPPEAAASGEGDRGRRGQRLRRGASGGGGAGGRGAPHAGERHGVRLPQSVSGAGARLTCLGGDEEGMASWIRRGSGFYRGYRRGDERAEEERRPGLLRSPRGSQPAGRDGLREIKMRCLLPALAAARPLGSKSQELCLCALFASWRLPWEHQGGVVGPRPGVLFGFLVAYS